MKCSAFNRKIEVNVDLVEKSGAEMEARFGFDNLCSLQCTEKHEYTVPLLGCLAWCAMQGHTKQNLYKMEPTASKRRISFSRPAQPLNTGQLKITQITFNYAFIICAF
jgi:hypothetical protein